MANQQVGGNGATSPVPTADRSRNVLQNVENLYNLEMVNRVFEDGSINAEKLVSGVIPVSNPNILTVKADDSLMYTTVAAAVADAVSGESIIVVYGWVNEPSFTVNKELVFFAGDAGADIDAPMTLSDTTYFHNLRIDDTINGSSYAEFNNCTIYGAFIGSGTANLVVNGGIMSTGGASCVTMANGTGNTRIHNAYVESANATGTILTSSSGFEGVKIRGSVIRNTGSGRSLSLTDSVNNTLLLTNSHFVGDVGSSSVYAAAEIFNCSVDGAFVSITPLASGAFSGSTYVY